MARKTKEEALETRERILEAAVEVFHMQGVARSTLEDIAEKAGVTRGAIYWHFENKSDLFSALHDNMHVSIMGGLREVADRNSADPLGELEDFTRKLLSDLVNDENFRKIHSLFTLRCDYSGELAVFLEEQTRKKTEALKIVESFFIRAKALGLIPKDADTALLSVTLFCFVSGICTEFLRFPALVDLEANGEKMIGQFFRQFRTIKSP